MSTTQVVVGKVGKPHGVRGEVSVELRTDEPERRFPPGAVLGTRTPVGELPGGDEPRSLQVRSTRWHQSRLLVTFVELDDRNAAEAARGLLLVTDVDTSESPEDPEEYYDHQLIGLEVLTVDGAAVGEVTEIVHGPAQDLLSIRGEEGREILVPFVADLVPTVDVPARRIVVQDRPGLLDPAIQDEDGGA